jgi:hypothetical protein
MTDFEATIPERYRAKYDSFNDRWLILDMWHPQIKNLSTLVEDIPETSPALKIITGTEMNAIMGEMGRNGHLDKIIESRGKSGIINKDVTDREERLLGAIERLIEVFGNEREPSIKRKRDKTPILNG